MIGRDGGYWVTKRDRTGRLRWVRDARDTRATHAVRNARSTLRSRVARQGRKARRLSQSERYGGFWQWLGYPDTSKCDPRYPHTEACMKSAYGDGRTLGRTEVRDLYHSIVSKGKSHVGQWAEQRLPGESEICAQARHASDHRLAARNYSRTRGSRLDELGLKIRDMAKYGPFSSARPRMRSDADCARILESSFRTNEWYDKKYSS
jgi:hypothetical protein